MDNKKILEKTKMKIAISNAKKENIVMKKDKLGKFIGIAACVVISTTGVAFATNEIIKKFGDNSSDGVQIAIDNQYYAEPNTEYKDANGISTSIDSFLIDDYNFDININLKFEDKNILNEMLENDGRIDTGDATGGDRAQKIEEIKEMQPFIFINGNNINNTSIFNLFLSKYKEIYSYACECRKDKKEDVLCLKIKYNILNFPKF